MSRPAEGAHHGIRPNARAPAHTQVPDALDHIQLEHERLRTLLDRARAAPRAARGVAARDLVDALVRHEAAEAVLVRPRTRATPDGRSVASELDRQERRIGRLASTLEQTDAGDDDAYADVLGRLREAVLRHLEAEEHAEHPRLRAVCDRQQLEELGRRLLRATRRELPEDEASVAFARTREVVRQALTA